MSRKTTHKIRQMKAKGKKIVMLTAYDAPTATILSGCERRQVSASVNSVDGAVSRLMEFSLRSSRLDVQSPCNGSRGNFTAAGKKQPTFVEMTSQRNQPILIGTRIETA